MIEEAEEMEYLILDIETTSLKITSEEVAEYIRSKRIVNGLHPIFSKIITIGLKGPDSEPLIFYGDNEGKILTKFWDYLKEQKPERIVTFNGYGFDIPFIYVRSYINKVKPTMAINKNKWSMEASNHFDCMLIFSQYGSFKFVPLDILCRLYDIPIPENRIGGEQLAEFYNKGDWETIAQHNAQDLAMTEKLYEKLQVG